MNFASPTWLWLLLLIPALAALLVWSWRIKQRLRARFVGLRLIGALTTGVSRERQRVRLILFLIALTSLLFALARPRLGFSLEEARQRGLDIVVAIDTSKSMLADDVQPNRLQRAKLAALDLMRVAASDRLGLVAFAGSAFLQCPLSLDEEAFRQSVEFLDVNVIPQGGTALTEAIAAARAAFKDGSENHKVLVLFTDGEENEDQETVLSAVREAAKAGLRIFTVGVGTPAGEVLSTTDPYGNRVFIKDAQGNVVKSRLNEPLLQQLARETDGFYLPLTGARTMEVLYERGLAPLPKSEFSTRTIRQHHERFQWFIGAGIVLLLIEMLFPERARTSEPRRPRGPAAAAAILFALLISAPAAAGSASDARRSYERGQFGKARSEFERLARKSPDDTRLRFNAGAAAFQEEDYETALKHFSATLGSPDVKLMQQGLYNLGNSYFRLGEKEKEPGKILEYWQQATNQFSLALKVDESDPDSKYNLEIVTRKIEELKKQQEQEQQQQQQQNQDDDEKKDEKDKSQETKNKEQQDKEKQQQEQEQKKDEDKKADSQKQDPQKQDQEKKEQQQQQQPGQEQKKPDEARSASQDQRGQEPNQGGEAANYNRVMAMTPQQAQQLLDAQKSEERAMIFQPQSLRTNRPPGDRVFKDW